MKRSNIIRNYNFGYFNSFGFKVTYKNLVILSLRSSENEYIKLTNKIIKELDAIFTKHKEQAKIARKTHNYSVAINLLIDVMQLVAELEQEERERERLGFYD